MPTWHSFLCRFITRLYYHRLTLLHRHRLPAYGPVMYVGLHRNGAVDGFVYASALPRATFMISTQLRKSLLGRIFFSGIEVVRGKDEGNREANLQALARCRDLLKGGGELFILPEGTSTLGPKRLPIKIGAARTILDAVEQGVPLTVIPLGIRYEEAWSLQSNVEIIVGMPIPTAVDSGLDSRGRLREMNRRIEAALDEVGVNVETAEYQNMIEGLAYASTLATKRSYFQSLKALELSTPENVRQERESLQGEARKSGLLVHQGIPLIPLSHPWLYVLALAVLGPPVVAAGLVNGVPLLGGYVAGRVLPDDTNVIALWRILVGLPLLALWVLALALVAVWTGFPWAFGLYLLVTVIGHRLYYRVKKLLVAVGNFLLHPGLRPRLLAFREHLLKALPDE